MNPRFATIDGNEAAARIAHATNEVIAIYPITPASPMGELADAWSNAGQAEYFWHRAGQSSRCKAKGERPEPCTVRCRPAR